MPGASEDTILFGNRNELIHNEFCDRIQDALQDGVTSLPLMGGDGEENETRAQKMLSKLRRIYIRNVDMAEMYNERNSFTVARRTNHFRSRIVERFHDRQQKDEGQTSGQPQQERPTSNDEEKGKLLDTTNTTCTSTSTSTTVSTNAIMEELRKHPSSSANTGSSLSKSTTIEQLEEEIKSVRLRLQKSQKDREEKLKQCKTLEEAVEFSKQAQDTLSTAINSAGGGCAGDDGGAIVIVSKVSNQVETMVQAQREYNTSLKPQGNRLIQKMDDLKQQKQDNENDDDDDNENDDDVYFDVQKQGQHHRQQVDDNNSLSSPMHKKIKKSSSSVLVVAQEDEQTSYEIQKRTILGGETQQPADLFALRDLLKK